MLPLLSSGHPVVGEEPGKELEAGFLSSRRP